jgi:hypothetical protein
MNRMGEQGEHPGRFRILSPRVLAKDLESAPLLTLLTPATHPTSQDYQVGDLA